MAYKRKTKTTITVTEEANLKSTAVDNNGEGTIVEREIPVSEMTVTAEPADLTVEPTVIYAGPAGVDTTIRVSGVAATTAVYSAGTFDYSIYSEFKGNALPDYFPATGKVDTDFSGSTSLSAMFSGAFSSVGDSVEFTSPYSPSGRFGEPAGFTYRNTGARVECTAFSTGYSSAATSYVLTGTVTRADSSKQPEHTANEVKVVPVSALEYNVEVAALPATDPHFASGSTKDIPQYTGYWKFEAQSYTGTPDVLEYSSMDTYVEYSQYSVTAGMVVLTDTATSVTAEIPVIQAMPVDPGTVHPIDIHSGNSRSGAPITILPAIKASAKAYHPADLETWTVQPNCDWVKFAPYSGSSASGFAPLEGKADDGTQYGIGSGTIAKAEIYSGGPEVKDSADKAQHALYVSEQENQKRQFFLLIDKNTTGKAREAYPTVTVGTKEYKLTVKQDA